MARPSYRIKQGVGGLQGRVDRMGAVSRGGAPVLKVSQVGGPGGMNAQLIQAETGFILYTENGGPIQYD